VDEANGGGVGLVVTAGSGDGGGHLGDPKCGSLIGSHGVGGLFLHGFEQGIELFASADESLVAALVDDDAAFHFGDPHFGITDEGHGDVRKESVSVGWFHRSRLFRSAFGYDSHPFFTAFATIE